MKEIKSEDMKRNLKILRSYHNWLLQNTDKKECLSSIDEFLKSKNI